MGRAWNRNPESANLPKIAVGDRVVLHLDEGFQYSVRADVVRISGEDIEVSVVDVFMRNPGVGQVTGGRVTELVGQTLHVKVHNVFEVLAKG